MALVKLTEIQWLQNSPLGGYLANDVVIVYIDDATLAISVTKNGSPVTSGTDISVFTSVFWRQYFTETRYYPVICSGTSSIEWRRRSYFPYAIYVTVPGALVCAVTPAVCDLVFNLPIVTPATSSTTANGQIQLSTQTTHGPVQYRLNNDFTYNDGNGQTSALFTTLLPGTYRAFARDSANCLAVQTINVTVKEPYTTLYTGQYTDRLGTPTQIEILQRAYAGNSTVVNFGGEPIIISLRGEGEDDVYKSIFSVEAVCTLKAERNGPDFSDLYTDDPEKFRLRFSKNYGSGYETLWEGKVLPNQFTESLQSAPYDVSITATDDLAKLKEVSFLSDAGLRFKGKLKQIHLLAFALQRLGYDHAIRVAVNLYATGMNQAASDDPLDQAWVDTDMYYLKEDELPTAEFIITSILEPYGARLIGWQNIWHVIRVDELTDAYDYRQYDKNGTYISNGSADPIINIKQATENNRVVWANRSGAVTLMPGYGLIQVRYDMGLKKSILTNADFELSNEYNPITATQILLPDLYGWTLVPNGDAPNLSYEQINKNNIAIRISNHTANAYLLSTPIALATALTERLKISIRYKIPKQSVELYYQKIKLRVSYGTWHLKGDGTWVNSVNEMAFYSNKFGEYVASEIIAQPIFNFVTTSGLDFKIRIYPSYGFDSEHTSLASLKSQTTTTLSLGVRTELFEPNFVSVDTIKYYELAENTEADNDNSIVRPNDYNASTNPVQWILKSVATAATLTSDFYIDYVSVSTITNNGVPSENTEFYEGQSNSRNYLEKKIYQGSLNEFVKFTPYFGIELYTGTGSLTIVDESLRNAKHIYSGYLRNSAGTGYTTWKRDGISESLTLESILMKQLTAHYGQTRKKISGELYSNDTYLTPLNTLRDTINSAGTTYVLMALVINDKTNMYQVEAIEKTTVSDDTTPGYAFNLGFSTGFDA